MGRLRGKSRNIFLYVLLFTTTFTIWFTIKSSKSSFSHGYHDYESIVRKAEKGVGSAIETSGCNILEFYSSNPSIAKYSKNIPKKVVCSHKLPLTEISGQSLILHGDRMSDYGSSLLSTTCYYQGIIRINQTPKLYDMDCDRKWELKEKIILTDRITMVQEDAVLVTCNNSVRQLYQNVHYFIHPLRADEKRQKYKAVVGERGDRPDKLSVVVLGTDSVSRGSLKRLMPKTYKYLTRELHAIDLHGFNKIGDNTHPNLLAMLTGLSKSDLQEHKCQSERAKSKFDNCPFIWKKFSEKGYVTIYGEDVPDMWAFHHDSPGFVEEPTDYYLRPYIQVSENFIGHNGSSKILERKVCQGPKMTMSVMHEYSLSIARALRDIPYFGFYWITSLTHDLLNAAALADEPSLEYLKRLNQGGYLEHTVLFFISDHGLRFGGFRSTYAGMLEERLPYVTIVFPKWFKDKYPYAIGNMEANARRLTSTYDLHATLLDIVNQAFTNPNQRTHRGVSLFREIPPERTCEDAFIPEHYCSCEHSREIDPSHPDLLNAAEAALEEINQGLSAFPGCVKLYLDRVLTGRVWSAKNNTSFGTQGMASTSYLVVFVTKPGGAMMEATVRYQVGTFKLGFDVSRINKFGDQSHCIRHPHYKAYCYCKDLLT